MTLQMTILKLNFASTIRSKFHHFSDSKTNCLLRCAPALYINLLVIPARNRTLGVATKKQAKIRFCQHVPCIRPLAIIVIPIVIHLNSIISLLKIQQLQNQTSEF